MKIDKYELLKQKKEEILKSGEYVRLEIIIPTTTADEKRVDPLTQLEVKNTNTVTLWCLYNMLDSIKETLIKKDPAIKLADMVLGQEIVDMGSVEKGDILDVED